MSKRHKHRHFYKRRSELISKPRNSVWFRWLGAAALAIGIVGGAILFSGRSPLEEGPSSPKPASSVLLKKHVNTRAEWYREKLSQAAGADFDSSTIEKLNRDEYAAFLSYIKGRLGFEPLSFTRLDKKRRFISLNLSGSDFKEFSDRINTDLIEFFKYLGISHLLPNTAFFKITPDTTFQEPKDEYLPIYLAWRILDIIEGEFLVVRNGRIEKGGAHVDILKSGEIQARYTFRYDPTGIPVLEGGARQVLISFDDSIVLSYTSPLAEALHYAVRQMKLNHIKAEIDKEHQRHKTSPKKGSLAGVSDSTLREKLGRILDEWVKREEAVVHAVLDQFITEKGVEIGFTEAEVAEFFGNPLRSISAYEYVPRIKEKVLQLRAAAVMRTYFEEPEKLFD